MVYTPILDKEPKLFQLLVTSETLNLTLTLRHGKTDGKSRPSVAARVPLSLNS